jgi:hypothetical protein
MTVEAYLSVDGSVPVDPQPLKTIWAPDLPNALRTRGTAVFEEQVVVRSLLDDLGGRGHEAEKPRSQERPTGEQA